ncbi:JmjC domain, hydroxylase-domain-containing protein [Lipomyces orientalis]|uniref:JmjC domain, hydroxylase-domain-containing protein n=1 Tax=Lipomyces orientalis TaxID=1233043 RepID=A0ACC3TD22_9ASCO
MMSCLVQSSPQRTPSLPSTNQNQQLQQFANPVDVPEREQLPISQAPTGRPVVPSVSDNQRTLVALTNQSSTSATTVAELPAYKTPLDNRMSISNLVTSEPVTPILSTPSQPCVESVQPTLPPSFNNSTSAIVAQSEPSLTIQSPVSGSGPALDELFSDDDIIVPESSAIGPNQSHSEFEEGVKEEEEDDDDDDDEEEEEEDDGEPIEPSHYYGGTVPVFRPTMDQFRSFPKFIKRIDNYGMKVGIVKVIPPPEWTAALPAVTEKLKEIRIRHPIIQHINGSQGVFSQTNIEKQRSYTLPQWRKVTEESDHQPPARRGERRKGADSKARMNVRKRPRTMSSAEDSSVAWAQASDPTQKPKRRNGELSAQEVAEFEDFDYRFNASEFTPERCEELERIYWKTITYNNPMYGADMLGSLFTDATKEWNVSHLDNILNDIGVDLPGVNTAYLYFGMWKSTFSWHVEDMDLYSINYLHFGAPKQWYSISQKDEKRFFNIMRSEWPDEYKKCKEFLRHKTFLVSPKYLADRGIKVNKLVHNQGEFVITFPFGYHSGYNLGYNCAESVNFASERWLQIGAKAKKCKCISDAVDIDVQDLAYRLKMKRRLARRMKREMEQKQSNENIAADSDNKEGPSAVSGEPENIAKPHEEPAVGAAPRELSDIEAASGTLAAESSNGWNDRQHSLADISDIVPHSSHDWKKGIPNNSTTIGIVE